MKTKMTLWYLLLMTGVAVATFSCKDDGEDPVYEPVFEVSDSPLAFNATPDGPVTVAVTAEHVDWTASVNEEAASWLSVDRDSDKITVTAGVNETVDSRSGTITVTPEGDVFQPVTIAVTQAGIDAVFTVDNTPLEFAATPEGTQNIAVEAENVEWTPSVDSEAASWLSVAKGDGAVIVTAAANTDYQTRQGTVTVTPAGDVFQPVTIAVSQAAAEIPPIDLPAPANSHIVAPGGSVYLAVDRAFTVWEEYLATELTGEIVPELVWETTVGLIDDIALVEGYTTGETAVIEVKTASSGNGNALVGVRIGGEIRWTWHLWVTDATMETKMSASGVKFMDRNLGAMAVGAVSTSEADLNKRTWGLYYQWGRPHPVLWADQAYFSAPASDTEQTSLAVPIVRYGADGEVVPYLGSRIEGNSTLATAINNPTSYLSVWNGADGDTSWQKDGAKTLFDPCPAGWKVPASTTWAAADYDSSSKKLSGTNIRGAAFAGSWFPGTGKYQYDLLMKKEDGFITDEPFDVSVNSAGTYLYYWFADLTAGGAPVCLSVAGMGNPNYATSNQARNIAQQIRCVEDTAAAR